MAEVDLGIPGFEWRSTLGRGGSGTVYEAGDDTHGRVVAVKVLDTDLDDAIRRRFDRERRAMGSLGSHPNIVTVLTSGFSDLGHPYLVMERIPGGTLADRLRERLLSVDEVVTIGVQLADALGAAHRVGIVHCDVKPANVLMHDDDRPVLTDFGIASVVSDRSMRVTVSATPSFAAPEILQGRDPDERSDIYSLAATLFACLDGHPPYGNTSETMLGVLYQIINAPVPTTTRTDVPPTVSRALYRAMAKEPDDRQATMAEFANELQGRTSPASPAASAPFEPTTTEPTTTEPAPTEPATTEPPTTEPAATDRAGARRARWPIVAGALLTLAALGLIAIVLANRGEDQVAVPAIEGLPLAEATAAIEAVGLVAEHPPACASAIARTADPVVGTDVATGSTIDLTIDACIVPDFVGLRLPEAIDVIMTIDGLSISWDDYCDDLVLGQDPAAGTALDFGSSIAIDLRPC